MTFFASLRRLLASRDIVPDPRSAAAYVRRLEELRMLLASDLAAHRIERGHA